jgi:peptidylprolyl isomerase
MIGLISWMMAISALYLGQTSQPAPADSSTEPSAERPLSQMVRAELRAPRTIVPVGSEVIVEFAIQNRTDAPVKLTVPGALPAKERTEYGMGLPLEHVFSGLNFRALEIVSDENPQLGDRVMRRPEYPVPAITVAPFGTVGLRFDIARFYPGLHQSGKYRLVWRPYGGALESEPLVIDVMQYKQITMETEYGSLNIELLYDKAPRHVANFLELVEQRFYNGKTFHTVYPGQFILGGCPKGDGTGRRPDGIRLPPEFNDTPFEEGTVGMALIEGDPNSGSSQFFICLGRQTSWDGRYTAFGQVRGPQSLATLQKLGQVSVDPQHRPVKPLIIKSMTATDMPFPPRQGR